MTDITVHSHEYQAENRSWLLSPHGTEPGTNPTVTLKTALFDKDKHYPNGYIPSGIVLAKSSDGTYGPFDKDATDGRATAVGLLFSSVSTKNGPKRVANALVWHGFVDAARLPIKEGAGALTTEARTSLNLIKFDN